MFDGLDIMGAIAATAVYAVMAGVLVGLSGMRSALKLRVLAVAAVWLALIVTLAALGGFAPGATGGLPGPVLAFLGFLGVHRGTALPEGSSGTHPARSSQFSARCRGCRRRGARTDKGCSNLSRSARTAGGRSQSGAANPWRNRENRHKSPSPSPRRRCAESGGCSEAHPMALLLLLSPGIIRGWKREPIAQ